MRAVMFACVVAACGTSSKPAATDTASAAAWIQSAKGFADAACACNGDKTCAKNLRPSWDAQKELMLKTSNGFAPADKTAFDAQIGRMQGCGDGAGVTFWK